ncbi:hypothetical protein J6590_051720 [Homalodisca vitripennis]|nr:hypothetical protein J6590_051720 [Homalodisca vitripennis]
MLITFRYLQPIMNSLYCRTIELIGEKLKQTQFAPRTLTCREVPRNDAQLSTGSGIIITVLPEEDGRSTLPDNDNTARALSFLGDSGKTATSGSGSGAANNGESWRGTVTSLAPVQSRPGRDLDSSTPFIQRLMRLRSRSLDPERSVGV